MTREEERLKAADEYIYKRVYEDNCGRTGDTFPAFIKGAEWADEHPNLDTFIEKACAWFRTLDDKEPPYETTEEFIKGFIKAMEQ